MKLIRRLLLFFVQDEGGIIAPPESAALREDSDNELQEDGDVSLREQ